MKKLGFFDKSIFFINSFFALALLASYLLPYISPISYPVISVLTLGIPLLVIINFVFLIFWVVRLRKQFLLSFVALVVGYSYVFSLFQIGGGEKGNENDLKLMSYNVRMFNAYNWVEDKDIPSKIAGFITEKDPDVLVTQEHYVGVAGLRDAFPYNYIKLKDKGSEFGSAIFSKYPIVNRQSLDFPQDGNNNAIFVDIVKNEDTIRVYNVHFQSLNIQPGLQEIKDADSKKLVGRIGYGFKLQQKQAELMMSEVNNSPYKTIILGDFNNTAFSYIYRYVKGERFKDAFLEAGSGFGKTFNLVYFPLRIDFMLLEKYFKVTSFQVFPVEYSDHFPIMITIDW
jgi:endonuclease/exonuclease/phosphatase family metal-dependent hydrolase